MRETIEDIVMNVITFIVPVIIIGLIVMIVSSMYASATGMNKAAIDVTENYAIPPELAGCRIYKLVSGGFGHSLYVVTRGDDPESVRWETGGKHSHGLSVGVMR